MTETIAWWDEEHALDTLHLSADEYFVLLSQLDARQHEHGRPDQRRRARTRYWRRRTVVLVHDVSGSRCAYDVKPHNISRTGIAFLHGFYIHPNTVCETALWTINKEPVAIRGKAVRCRHLRGRTHEVGVQFDTPIDLSMFLGDYTPPKGEEVPPENLPRFSGRVLYVDDSVDNRELVGYIAGELGIALRTTARVAEALETAGKNRFDIVIAKLRLPDGGALELAQSLRERDYAGTIVALGDSGTPDSSAPSDNKAPRALNGCDRVLTPPITLERMAALFRCYLPCEESEQKPVEPLVSTHWPNVGMRPFILKFVARMEERVRTLEALAARRQLDDFRKACDDFKGSAESYGYSKIAQALRELDSLAAGDGQPDQLKPVLADLLRLCAAASLACVSQDHAPGPPDRYPPERAT